MNERPNEKKNKLARKYEIHIILYEKSYDSFDPITLDSSNSAST